MRKNSVFSKIPPQHKSLRTVFIISRKVPVKIYFHAKDQYLDLSGRMGYKAYVGEDMQAQINYEDIKLISRYSADFPRKTKYRGNTGGIP